MLPARSAARSAQRAAARSSGRRNDRRRRAAGLLLLNAFVEWGEAATKPKPGDRVLFAQYSGAREKGADGEDYVVMNDKDLLAVIEASQ